MLISQAESAQNKVVVIPLAGDDSSPLEATTPVAKVDPAQTDYNLMANTTIDNITGFAFRLRIRCYRAAGRYSVGI